MLIAVSGPAAAEFVLEHNAHGGLVSINVTDCMLSEKRDYADAEAAEAANFVKEHTVDLQDVSVWVHRPDNGTSKAFKIGSKCEAWRYADQCMKLDEALNVSSGQEIRLACDDMYVSCIRTHHLQGNFKLQTSLQILWWKEESASDNFNTQQQVLSTLHGAVEACKTKHGVQEAVFREHNEGAILKAQDKVRIHLQDLDAEFRKILIYGPSFAPAVCGEVKTAGGDAYLRFVVSGPVGTKVDRPGRDSTFELDYWGRYCN